MTRPCGETTAALRFRLPLMLAVLTLSSASPYSYQSGNSTQYSTGTQAQDTLLVAFNYSVDAPPDSFYAHQAEIPHERANQLLSDVAKAAVDEGFKVLLPVSHLRKQLAWREGPRSPSEQGYQATQAGVLELEALRSTIAGTSIDWAAWREYRRVYNARRTWESNDLLLGEWKVNSIDIYDDTRRPDAVAVLTLTVKYYTKRYYNTQFGTGVPIEAMDAQASLTWGGSPILLALDPADCLGLVKSSAHAVEGTTFGPKWRERYSSGVTEANHTTHDILLAFSRAVKSLRTERPVKALSK